MVRTNKVKVDNICWKIYSPPPQHHLAPKCQGRLQKILRISLPSLAPVMAVNISFGRGNILTSGYQAGTVQEMVFEPVHTLTFRCVATNYNCEI